MRPGVPFGIGRIFVVFLVVAGAALLVSSERPAYSPSEKAFYADPKLVDFVRPGLVTKITSAEIATDGTIRARVKITDPKGLPLDREGITSPGAVGISFVAGFIPAGEAQYKGITTRVQTSPITGVAATQPAADSGGTWQKVADGEYQYTFRTKAPATLDRSGVITVYVYSNRNLSEFELGTQYSEDLFHIGKTEMARDVVADTSCRKCHSFERSGLHGGQRRAVGGCVMCHTEGVIDPDTGESVDMDTMIHKIHAGSELPSVQAGKPYVIIGNSQSRHDYSHIAFSVFNQEQPGVIDCAACHERKNETAKQKDLYLTPNRQACGSCHDNVNFATGENHADLPQVSDANCSRCHQPQGDMEFDLSVKGAHTITEMSTAREGINLNIIEITGKAGEKPTVKFSVKDNAGNPIPLEKFMPAPGGLRLVMAGPAWDYGYMAFGTGRPVGYMSEDVRTASKCGSDGVCTYTFTNGIPADAKGTLSMSMEGRLGVTVNPGTRREVHGEYGGKNVVKYFSVDGSPVGGRRQVVAIAKCNECHGELRMHGQNRNQIEHCVTCHNPSETDASRRPAGQLPETVNMAYMIHRLHAGSQATGEYTVYGFGGTAYDFTHIGYPARLQECDRCHVNGSQNVDGKESNQMVRNSRGPARTQTDPAGPITAACGSCHTSRAAWSHALANTTALGESCAACHGANAEFSVSKVHAQ
jgi:OmcA/MtrC family decaheme c-type cytochrome